jgi:hypothetical protein
VSPDEIRAAINATRRKTGLHIVPGASAKDAEAFMEALDLAMQGHGVERLADDGHRPYWRDAAGLYVNVGDCFSTTAIYDTDEEVIAVKSVDDFIEEKAREGAVFD